MQKTSSARRLRTFGSGARTHPYVVPIHYAYDEPHVYIYTTEGKKTEIIDANPEVCLQVEEVTNANHWQSVIITGDAVQLTSKKEIAGAKKLILRESALNTRAQYSLDGLVGGLKL